jgi:hypothetical protein
VRPAFQTIKAASYDANQGTKTVGGFVGYINKDDWLRYDKVDLGPPGTTGATFVARVAAPDKWAGHTIEVRLDSLNGPVLATLKIQTTGGQTEWRSQSVPTTSYPGGVHDLFLRFSGGGWNFDTFKFTLNSRPGLGPIEAVNFNDSKGVATRGGVVGETTDGGWVRFNGLDFGPGVNAVAITYSCDDPHAGGSILLRMDKVDGPVVAQLRVDSTGSFGRYVTRTIPLDAVAGSHDVFLSFSGKWHGIANVSKIEFQRQAGNPWHPVSSSGASVKGE